MSRFLCGGYHRAPTHSPATHAHTRTHTHAHVQTNVLVQSPREAMKRTSVNPSLKPLSENHGKKQGPHGPSPQPLSPPKSMPLHPCLATVVVESTITFSKSPSNQPTCARIGPKRPNGNVNGSQSLKRSKGAKLGRMKRIQKQICTWDSSSARFTCVIWSARRGCAQSYRFTTKHVES